MCSAMPDVAPRLDAAACDALRVALVRADYTVDGVARLLGPAARAALDRGEPVPALRASEGAGPLGQLVRLFLLVEPVDADAAAAVLAPLELDTAIGAGLLARDAEHGDRVRAALDLRPHADDAVPGPWWVLSDLDPSSRRFARQDDPHSRRPARADAGAPGGPAAAREHVLGTGAASLSLARATVRRPVQTLLDLGTGCGIQVLHAAGHARRCTATDVSDRALGMAEATLRMSGVSAELLVGPWWEPVAGRRFDQIVANPPFVPGPPDVEHVYRDGGLGGDGTSALVVGAVPGFLAEGGVGQLLASWLITEGATWSDRPRAWLAAATESAAPGGLDAWVVQRDVADPALHVGTWLRDAGVDPASPAGRERSNRWLDFLADQNVVGIGFGFVTLRRTAPGVAGTVVCEDLRQAHDDPLGPEIAAWLDRVAWLATGDLRGARLRVPDTVALERGLAGGDEGWEPVAATLVRLDGPQWRHDLDELGVALLAGCRGHLPLDDLLALLALAHDRDVDDLAAAALPVVRELYLHGCLEVVDGSGGDA